MADTEQGGAPSATAGGAPAPDQLGKAVAEAFTEALSGVTKAWKQIVAANPGLAYLAEPPAAEIVPAEERKAVYGEPGIDTDWDEDADAMLIHGVGWNLSWGCKLSIARDHDTGEHYVCVNTSGEDQRRGIVSRRTTREQIASFGQQLLNVFGEPDPRDAEIERLRGEVYSNNVAMGGFVTRIATALGGKSFGDARELVDDVLRLVRDCADNAEEWQRADAEVTRLCAQVDELAGIRVALFGEVRQALTERDDYARRLRDTDAAYAKVTAERDRLRQELDLIGGQVPKFRDGQRVRIGRHFGTVEKPKAVTRVRLDGMAPAALFETRLVNAIEDAPAEPRRWVAGDAEPEIGTTITWGFGGTSWTRCGDGVWRSDTCKCKSCRTAPGLSWTVLIDEARAPLVEVVSTDGD